VLYLSGCKSVADFDASTLPDEYRSKSKGALQDVDLSRIASRATSTNTIYPGDVLDVTLTSGVEEQSPTPVSMRVDSNGQLNVPLVGSVAVGGLSMSDAEIVIRAASIEREIYRSPHVAVVMRERNTIKVRVVGAVVNPGVYDLPAVGSDLLSAMVAAGGLDKTAGSIVEVRHPNGMQNSSMNSSSDVQLASFMVPDTPVRMSRVDLSRLDNTSTQDLSVEDGSVVMVMPETTKSITVIGNVRKPGTYELPVGQELRVLDALAMAGDRTISVANRVRVIRRMENDNDNDPVVIEVSVRNAKLDGNENLVISAGDIISVEDTPTTVITQTIRSFLRFGFTSAVPGL
jgi:polysaccharide export outer membrane protein